MTPETGLARAVSVCIAHQNVIASETSLEDLAAGFRPRFNSAMACAHTLKMLEGEDA